MDQKERKATQDFLDELQNAFEQVGYEIHPVVETPAAPGPVPPEKAIEAYLAVKDYFFNMDKLARAAIAFEDLIPKKKQEVKPLYTEKYFKNEFFGYPDTDRVYRLQETLSPISVALITLQEFFSEARFEFFDPRDLPYAKKLMMGLQYEEPIWIPVSLGPNKFTVADQREMWVRDRITDKLFVIHYGVMAGGSLKIQIECAWEQSIYASALLIEVKEAIIQSKYFRGQILELAPRGFTILDIGEQKMPIIEKNLLQELDKNVINLFEKAEEFKKYGLPIKRAIILEGLPGNGKTMVSRYLAYTLKGRVTVLWITAKAIDGASDIVQIFEMARKLSPCLVIMEDLDLMAGTRHGDAECLGEMLNQLDGIQPNESLVLVASTNAVKALDAALRERPGRFDRIYQIGKPSPEVAEQIARQYLKSKQVSEPIIDSLSYAAIIKGDLTGAQIVEVVKGAIFEAIHRGCDINEMCLNASYRGLMEQIRWTSDN